MVNRGSFCSKESADSYLMEFMDGFKWPALTNYLPCSKVVSIVLKNSQFYMLGHSWMVWNDQY